MKRPYAVMSLSPRASNKTSASMDQLTYMLFVELHRRWIVNPSPEKAYVLTGQIDDGVPTARLTMVESSEEALQMVAAQKLFFPATYSRVLERSQTESFIASMKDGQGWR